MASHCYLVGPSGELFIEYLVRHAAMFGLHRDDTERSRELDSSSGGYYPFVYKKVEVCISGKKFWNLQWVVCCLFFNIFSNFILHS